MIRLRLTFGCLRWAVLLGGIYRLGGDFRSAGCRAGGILQKSSAGEASRRRSADFRPQGLGGSLRKTTHRPPTIIANRRKPRSKRRCRR